MLCPSLTNWKIVYGLEKLLRAILTGFKLQELPRRDFWLKTECCYSTRGMCEEFNVFEVTFWNYFSYCKSGF